VCTKYNNCCIKKKKKKRLRLTTRCVSVRDLGKTARFRWWYLRTLSRPRASPIRWWMGRRGVAATSCAANWWLMREVRVRSATAVLVTAAVRVHVNDIHKQKIKKHIGEYDLDHHWWNEQISVNRTRLKYNTYPGTPGWGGQWGPLPPLRFSRHLQNWKLFYIKLILGIQWLFYNPCI
jgi:hypothetical protein